MAMSKDEFLPKELIIDILYRLPVKSIGRCRCLSKHWRNFLSDPQFIKLHFNLHAHTQEKKLIIVTWQCELYTITFIPQNGGEIHGISRKVNFQHSSHNWKSVAGSCNGLVLMVGREKIHFLNNPTTLKHHQIPMFDSLLPLHRTCYMYGLGYDVVNDDYKVVVLSYPVKNKTVTCVYMYSVRKGLWEKLENSPYDHSPFEPRSGVLVNGALHWLARTTSENSTTIAAFDLSVDKFSEGVFVYPPIPYLDTDTFWMMKEYGVKESWTKFKITVHVPLTTLLCSIGDDDVLLDTDEELVVYNMKENRRKDLLIDVNPLFYEGRTFVDSLVSPYFGSETEG
ncbi:hypothetical protein MTR67_003703 [Solanum verrucosum]|uniref:F-box domain-containing protein n=1 Tax=Solanum verrucosum TaxID=315347 RepID=A0AAF0PSN9_SOLVR|nr:F-box/kelch-repeat protein At3g06240-like [Solanum verrucosum]WMV10318.1 hypothetical protein MTR67_003703 [Solanum verrucosum]